MLLQNEILEALVLDGKKRVVERVNNFADIVFREDNSFGETVYSICQIHLHGKYGFSDGVEKKKFFFKMRILDVVKRNKLQSIFKPHTLSISDDDEYIVMERYGLDEEVRQRMGALGDNEVYGYCTLDGYNSENPFAQKLSLTKYHESVAEYIEKHPRREYSDIWELSSSDDFSNAVQKKYFSYAREIPQEINTCRNLRSLAIWQQDLKDDSLDFSNLRNLNELSLSNLFSYPDKQLLSLHKLSSLVSLTLSNESESPVLKPFDLPVRLSSLKYLRYFDFSGNPLKDWLPILSVSTLKRLILSHTNITSIPDNISKLVNLEELDLSNNEITELPESLREMKNLVVLNLSNNPLYELPEWIAEMTQLKELDASKTKLTSLPGSIYKLKDLKVLALKKNQFTTLPKRLGNFPEEIIDLEERFRALYDDEAKAKFANYPKGEALFENDFNFKLQVIQKLMYEDEVLLPRFSVYEFAKNHTARAIDIDEEGYNIIPEVAEYFKNLAIPMELLIDIKDLSGDGGDSIYLQLIPLWDGEDGSFMVESVADVTLLPNLKRIYDLFYTEETVAELRSHNIEIV